MTEEDGLGEYFEKHWLNNVKIWAVQYRSDVLAMGNHTTNRIERYHRTLKRMLGNTSVRFPELIQVLLDLILLRLSDRERKARLCEIRYATAKPPVLLKGLSDVITPYALSLVLKQMVLPSTSYNTIAVTIHLYMSGAYTY